MFVGASGVGALLVRTLASLGATVIVLDINQCEDENGTRHLVDCLVVCVAS